MIVARVSPRLMLKFTELLACNGKAAGHAEMHDEDLIRRQGKRQELRLAAQMGDTRTAEAIGEPVGEGKP